MHQETKAVFTQQQVSNVFHLYISGSIGEPENYTEIFQVLRCAGPNDVVNLYLNTPGGYFNTSVQFRAALLGTQATTIAHLEGECFSGGSIIALSCDDLVLHNHSILMLHTYSGGSWGKSPDLLRSVSFQDGWIKEAMQDTYENFLNAEEMQKLFNGKDIWLKKGEIEERWKNVLDNRELEEEIQKEEIRKKIRESSLEVEIV